MTHYRRTDLGERLFFRIAVDDPFGPRFERTQVAQADLLTYALTESEQRYGESVTWSLYAGDTLLAERTLGPQDADARP